MPTHPRMPQSGREIVPPVRKHGRGEKRERDRRVTRRAAKRQGVQTPPPISGSSGEGEVDTSSPISSACSSFSTSRCGSHVDGGWAGEHRWKHPRAEAGPPTGSPSQLLPMQVISDHKGEDDSFVCTSKEKVGLTLRSEIQKVLASPAATVAATTSNLGEAEPPPKKAHTINCLPPSTRYVHWGCSMLIV
jgi:hypothetical protein